ncbi:hypothetical protein [Methanoregula sp.]|uniref:hypothetical protein n=1 Tax=Methanoregula sp. TaxID=2052170 RepID=UPI003BAE6458
MKNRRDLSFAFPGIFRDALDVYATRISGEMKIAAAHALAGYVKCPRRECILPRLLNRNVVKAVAGAVREATIKSSCAREF